MGKEDGQLGSDATHLPRKHLGTVLSFRRRSLIKFTFLLIIKWYSFSPFSAIMTYASRSMPSFRPAWGHDCQGVTGGSLGFWYSCLLTSHWHSHRALPDPWSMSHTYQGLLRRTGKGPRLSPRVTGSPLTQSQAPKP